VFACLGLALAAAAALLLHRAWSEAVAEDAARRETLAARLFDELERALSERLGREEARPWDAWLEAAPDPEGLVAARFVLGAEGRLTLSPGTPPRLASRLERWAERPGTAAQAAAAPEVAESPPRQDSLYDALQSLNRGAEPRLQRARKLEAAARADAPRPPPEAPPEAPRPAAAAAAEDAAGIRVEEQGQPGPAVAPPPARSASVAVDPLRGRWLAPDDVLLVRSVWAGKRGQRQGVVWSLPALRAWLGGVAAEALPGARVDVAPAATASAGAGADAGGEGPGAALRRRFAPPFAMLAAGIGLPALPDSGSADTVLRLSLALVLLGAGLLFALYRMVAVTWSFAERRSHLVTAVSHELKTPVTAIRMYGEMLRDGLVSGEEKRREYHHTITAESERLSRLIDNVLESSRLGRDARPLALHEGDAGRELARVLETLRPHASEQGFSLVLELEPSLPPVRYDRDALAQIVVNLVDNGLKYARAAAERRIDVAGRRRDGGLEISVRDHGPGLPQRDVARAFDPFWRGEDALTRRTRGTGLGLPLVRSLAERMHGRVHAANAPGGGLEVRLWLPACAESG